MSGEQTSGAQESDLELKKKVVLYYHELFQASMSHWFVLM